MPCRKYRRFVGDFETTVYEGQTATEVWASALVEIGKTFVHVHHSIAETWDYLNSLGENVIVYYHNLKFDGVFWLNYLLQQKGLTQAIQYAEDGNPLSAEFMAPKDMPNNSVLYSISDMGQWYRIIVKRNHKFIEFRDSLKLLPFSVKAIGDSFKTEHRKLEIEYEGLRYAGCEITEQEREYIANDVLVVKEALEIMFAEGHDKLTIGSCCLSEFKRIIGKEEYKLLFPNLYDIEIDQKQYGVPNAGEYIRNSYRGGWVYAVPEKCSKELHNGITADVNSLYPSMMHSESGNEYPVSEPHFWTGDYIPDIARAPGMYYFVRIRTRFDIKPGYLPFIQIKRNRMYKATQVLTSSDVYNHTDGKYYSHYVSLDGDIKPATVVLTLTQTDYELIKEHYYLSDFEILDGCYFIAQSGIFDEYIDKYRKIKEENKGAKRTLAKLYLNNLYGKMASSTDSSFKVAQVLEDGSIGFYQVTANDKIPGYIPIGSAITSYARNFTIRAAQKNYHGPDSPGFVYADTDSIHCERVSPEELKGVPVHPTAFCNWKLESTWDTGYFVRAKTYIEHVTHEDLQPVTPYYNIKCAGMPERCKDYFLASMGEKELSPRDLQNTQIADFVKKKRTLEDFDIGLCVPGKLIPVRIPGGIVLRSTTYEMR